MYELFKTVERLKRSIRCLWTRVKALESNAPASASVPATTNAAELTTGTLSDARLSSNVTLSGNTFNGANQLVKTDGTNKLPAVDGSLLINLPVQSSSVADNSITNTKLADMATGTFKARNTTGTGDPEDITAVTARTLMGFVNYINVKDYGATGDGTTNDQAAIASAIAATPVTGTLYFPAGNYLVNTTVTVNKSITLVGEPYARIKVTANISAITLGANNIKIHKLSFIGSGKAGANTSQIGVHCNGFYYFDVAGCEFYNLNGIGLYWLNTTVGSIRYGGRVSNCYFNGNNIGFQSGVAGEYVTLTGGTAQANNIGGILQGGNVAIANMSIVDNGVGLEWRAGTNNGHGSVTGCMINHNTSYNIKMADNALGTAFSGCQLFDSKIWLKNTDGVTFSGCEIASISLDFENSKNTIFTGCTFYAGYGFTINNNFNTTTSSTYYTGNIKLTGTTGLISGSNLTALP